MKFSRFIARRFYNDPETRKRPIAQLAIFIATAGIALGLAVMVATVCIVIGFKNEISNKVVGFATDITIFNSSSASSDETGIALSSTLIQKLTSISNIAHIQRSSAKFGIVKTNSDYKGIVFKGISKDYDQTFIKNRITQGKMPSFSSAEDANRIVLGAPTAKELGLKVGDKVYAYFFEKDIKVRRFLIAGIFETDMQQIDGNIAYAQLATVNQLNGWKGDDQCTTMEVTVKDKQLTDETCILVNHALRELQIDDSQQYVAYTVRQQYGQIFDWLQLLDLNIAVILILMAALSCLTAISGMLILIMEKTSIIGLLKALGASNSAIRKIFIWYASWITLRGILLGYVIGIGLMAIQYQWHIVTLDPEKYYVNTVPVQFNFPLLLLLGITTFAICLLSLAGPGVIISHIRPSRTLKFE